MIQEKLLSNTLKEEQAIQYLEERGYVVVKNETSKKCKQITNQEVIELFNDRIKEKYTTELGDLFSIQEKNKNSSKALKAFQEKAKKQGISKFKANQLLYDMILLIFKYYDKLGISVPLTSIQWLLSEKGYWVINKTLYLHSKYIHEYEDSLEYKEHLDSLCEQVDDKINKVVSDRHNNLFNLYKELHQGE